MQVITNPLVKEWQNYTEPFTISFVAIGDKGRRLEQDEFHITYDITYNGEAPNLNNVTATTIESNNDGEIFITVNHKCRISVLAKLYDSVTKESQTILVADNQFIPLAYYITSFKAEYIGTIIPSVSDEILLRDIQCTFTKSDGSTKIITANELHNVKLSTKYVERTGSNKITIYYNDTLLNKVWKYDIIVNGKVKETGITAKYIGDKKNFGDAISKEEIVVNLLLYDGVENSSTVLSTDKWQFSIIPKINDKNLGIFFVNYNGLSTSVRVPFKYNDSDHYLNGWYEGPDIKVGHQFDPINLVVLLIDNRRRWKEIDYRDIKIEPSDMKITSEGINWILVSYNFNNHILRLRIGIRGYIEKDYQSNDFLVQYFNDNTHTVDDVTKKFDNACMMYGKRYFNWGRFHDMAMHLGLYGRFRVFAPKRTGLNTRYDTEWLVYCYPKIIYNYLLINRPLVKATLMKEFRKEVPYGKTEKIDRSYYTDDSFKY